MITRDILKKEGYNHYLDYKNRNVYQKVIRDSLGYKKYYINIIESETDILRYEATVQFTTKEETFDLTLLDKQVHTLQDVERFFDIMWFTLDCLYYEGTSKKT